MANSKEVDLSRKVGLSLTETLEFHEGGEFYDRLNSAFHEILHAMQSTGGKVSLSLKVTLKPASREYPMTGFVMETEVRKTVPNPPSMPSTMYLTPEGQPCLMNPKQLRLDDPVDVLPIRVAT